MRAHRNGCGRKSALAYRRDLGRMDYILLIVSGFVFGLFAAVPIGPVNLLCIRRTLEYGSIHGFVAGLGATMGDGMFAIITGFGLTAVGQLIKGFSAPLQLIGGLLLLSIGLRTYFAKPAPRFEVKVAANENGKGKATLARSVASTFALTISNPAPLFVFTALFTGLGGLAGGHPSFFGTAFVVAGVFGGSATWWLVLTTGVGLLHARIDERVVRIINKVSGFAFAAFGLAILLHLAIERVF
jgi:threonine/homoserine/homoserine lactone efflux protein